MKYWWKCLKEAKFQLCYTDTCTAVKQSQSPYTFFVYHNNSHLLLSKKWCLLYSIEDLTQSLWTVTNFAIVQMADALTPFNVVKLPRTNWNLINRPSYKYKNPNFRSKMKISDDILCLGFRSWYKTCRSRLWSLQLCTKLFWSVAFSLVNFNSLAPYYIYKVYFLSRLDRSYEAENQ